MARKSPPTAITTTRSRSFERATVLRPTCILSRAWTILGGGEYSLKVFDGSLPDNLEQPEVTLAPVEQAETIVCGQTVTGEITDDDWRDFWQFRGLVDQTVTVSMRGAAGAELESALVLSDGSGHVLARSTGIGDAQLEQTLSERAPHTIEATRRAGESGMSGGSYSLLLDCDIAYVPLLEPDLHVIELDGDWPGILQESDEVHISQLRLTEPATVSVRMTAETGNLVPGLTLWKNGIEIAVGRRQQF